MSERGPMDAAPVRRAGTAHRHIAPIREVYRLKRFVQVFVYGTILGTEPFYWFVLHYSPVQMIVGLAIGLMIATSAIEGAFNQMFKLRKRSSYPSIFLVELGVRASAADAARGALVTVRELLDVSAAFVALREADTLSLEASDGVPSQLIAAFLQEDGARDAMRLLEPVGVHITQPEPACLVFVPIVAWQKPLGVLGLVAPRYSGDVKDKELLVGIGNAIGLSLEDLRQKEGLQQSLSLLSATLDSTGDGIVVVDRSGAIVNFNRRFKDIWQIPDQVLETGDNNRVISYALTQLEDPEEFLHKLTEVYTYDEAEGYDTIHFKDGRAFERYSQPHRLNDVVVGRVWSFRDITDRKQSEETIRHLAYHDALTDLPNRALFQDRLTVALAQARRVGQGLAVMFLDLDRFKLINDTLGHGAGDELLKSLAIELGALVRQGDTVARVGGDEFTLLLTGVSREDVEQVAQRALDTVRRTRVVTGQELRVTTSIGIAFFPRDGADVESLLRNADTAMYRAKQQGRDNYQTYAPAMSAEILDRVSLEAELRRATNHGEFVLHYQPQVEASTGRITGAEALIRWNHPDRGLIPPREFISVAEECGLIIPIGDWVLETAARQNKEWQERGLPRITVTVNVAARQFEQNLVEKIAHVLDGVGLDASSLEIEITESTTINDPDFAAGILAQVRMMGVHVSIDDFGTGYSSLSYLKRFRIDRLKIDRSFVSDLITDQNDAAIATAMILMAHGLGLTVVAEGVETVAQLNFLLEQGCDHLQGYLLGRPMPAEDFERLLEAGAVVEMPGEDEITRRRRIRNLA
ncbi:MAG: EAL domain-containing protein [Dehalococcoidia bacterium]